MQAKKRAKPVKFGRPPEKKHEVHEAAEEKEMPNEPAEITAEDKELSEGPPQEEHESGEQSQEIVQRDEHIREDLTYKQKEPDITYSQTREENIRTQELRDNRPDRESVASHEHTDHRAGIPESHEQNFGEEPHSQNEQLESVNRGAPNNYSEVNEQAAESEPSQPAQADQQGQDDNYPSLGGDTYIVEKEVRSGMLGYFFLIAIVAFLIGIGSMAAANFYLLNSKPSFNLPFLNTATATPTPAQEPTRAPTPTPAAVDKSEVSINILNGSGITGAAAKLESSLDSDGYNVITRGNADNSDYTDTIIRAKDTVSDAYLDELSEFLSETYSVSSDIETASGSADDADVTIIIGSKDAASN